MEGKAKVALTFALYQGDQLLRRPRHLRREAGGREPVGRRVDTGPHTEDGGEDDDIQHASTVDLRQRRHPGSSGPVSGCFPRRAATSRDRLPDSQGNAVGEDGEPKATRLTAAPLRSGPGCRPDQGALASQPTLPRTARWAGASTPNASNSFTRHFLECPINAD